MFTVPEHKVKILPCKAFNVIPKTSNIFVTSAFVGWRCGFAGKTGYLRVAFVRGAALSGFSGGNEIFWQEFLWGAGENVCRLPLCQ